ncbi:RagB/SusD family nutrient uptake outer membrane protein [Gracilimonas mengyeensis]|uniref:RagB/SusD domain-containing protein n=1 Tax=Gracilimonas mengyeensis TaxID=1302730 RepID=A0A521BTI7_9BACT|nr:RagB/SusD family nutrient uptake outer membrane protein [Gracilimonas mengyeensis]SMO50467.1 RagB/SusD domain-containing protein [Gracilimonas mengyeensis]
MKLIKSLLIVLLVVSWGCDDQILNKQSPNEVTAASFYKTEEDAVAAINAVYDPLQYRGLFTNSYWSIGDITSDDADKGDGGKSDGPAWWEFDLFDIKSTNSLLTESWADSYTGIYRANIALERIPDIEMDNNLKQRLMGEAKFLRGFYYFWLVRLFGDVPLITEPQSLGDLKVSRTPKEEVYAFLIKDLSEAAEVLPETYSGSDLGRITKGAANGMLAKVYMWRKDWQKAADHSKKVIDSGVYELLENYGDNFEQEFENSKESVFEIQYVEGGPNGPWGNTADGNIIHISTAPRNSGMPGLEGWGFNMPTQDLVDAFEEGDPRLEATVLMEGSTIGGKEYNPEWSSTGYNSRKYLIKTEGFIGWGEDSPVNVRVMRYSEVLLMYAEALNELGETAQAYPYVNQVRARAGLDDLAAGMGQSAFREAVYHERRVELAQEGHRWWDLVRTGRALDVMRAQGRDNIQEHHLLFPIPQSEIDVNPELTQNPGY